MRDAASKFLGQKLRDLQVAIPRLMSATVRTDRNIPTETLVVLDVDISTEVNAVSLIGPIEEGARVKCLSYPPRGLVIIGRTDGLFSMLRSGNTTDVSMTSLLHALQIGRDNSLHLAMDNNEIQVRTGPAVADVFPSGTLALNVGGGNITMGNAASTVEVNGQLNVDGAGILSTSMRHRWDTEPTNNALYNSVTGTLGTGTNGFTFVAPPSGAGTFQCGGFGRVNVATITGKFWGEIREGGTIGSGTLVHDGDSDNGPMIRVQAESASVDFYVGACGTLVSGLTPGDTYNASGWYAVVAAGGAGAGLQMFARQLSWIPSP